jgi:hypothetical protein
MPDEFCAKHQRKWDSDVWACCPGCAEDYENTPPTPAKATFKNLYCRLGFHKYQPMPGTHYVGEIMGCVRCGDWYSNRMAG